VTARDPRVARKLKRQSPVGSIVHRHHKGHAEEVYTSSDGEFPSSERVTDPSASDQGGNDDCQPKRRDSASEFGTSIWTTQEWKLLLASGDVSDSDETSVDDGRPRTHTKPSKYKTKWSATKAHTQIKSSLKILKDWKKGAPFTALRLPDSINWLEPELMKGKTLKDAELRANTAGTCGLSALTCLKTSRAHADNIHTICKSLPPLADASQECGSLEGLERRALACRPLRGKISSFCISNFSKR
jgi:hypothetical protein